MTKIEELEQKVKELQEEISKLKNEEKIGKWEPEEGDRYYFLDSVGDIEWNVWSGGETSKWRYNNIKIFETQEECRRYKKFIEDINEHKYEFRDEDWELEDVCKYYILRDYHEKKLTIGYGYSFRAEGEIDFKTKEDAQYIIDNYREEILRGWL